ncbi:MAG: GNAT family N-acetyltransferase [Bdellovibrionales bacterium]|nr:GNAT family N-acetyltransferase [Bdellovibrionales bacterium]
MAKRETLELSGEGIRLRPIARSDGTWLSALYGTNANMAMIPGGIRDDEESARHLDLFLAHWDQHKIGMWIIEKEDSEHPVGYAGLRYIELEGTLQLELGLIIDRLFWRQGIGFAAVQLILNFVDTSRPEECTVALIEPANIASQTLLARFGFVYQRDVECRGTTSQLWCRHNRR